MVAGERVTMYNVTLKVLVTTIDAQWEGMGDVGSARYEPALLPPSPHTALSLSCFKVLQCINCRDWHCKS